MYQNFKRWGLFIGALLLLGLVFKLSNSPDEAQAVLEKHGYTHIQIKDSYALSCLPDDLLRRPFVAQDASGHRVSGAVCSDGFLAHIQMDNH